MFRFQSSSSFGSGSIQFLELVLVLSYGSGSSPDLSCVSIPVLIQFCVGSSSISGFNSSARSCSGGSTGFSSVSIRILL